MTPSVATVNVLHKVVPGRFHDTAIDKRPVPGPVKIGELGLAGDRQLHSSHGGPDKAVYVYATEDAVWWEAELGRDVPPGLFAIERRPTHGVTVAGLATTTDAAAMQHLLDSGVPLAKNVRAKARRIVDRATASRV